MIGDQLKPFLSSDGHCAWLHNQFMSPANIMEQDQECKIAMTEIFSVPFVRNKNET